MPRLRSSLFLSLFLLLTPTANAQSPRSAQDFFNRGWEQFSKGDYERAVASFTRVIEVNRPHRERLRGGQNWAANTPHGNSASDSDRDFNRAIADLNRAIELDPQFARAFGNRGLTRLGLGQTADAEKDFAECLKLDPSLKPDLDRSIRAVHASRKQP